MGFFDTINNKMPDFASNPLKMGLLAYGMTGKGNDPGGAAVRAMLGASEAKAKQDEQARQKAQQDALLRRIKGGLSTGNFDTNAMADYIAAGGEGAGELSKLVQFYGTPQSYTPGSGMYDPRTQQMTMPMPKMGEGQMWTGQGVAEAPGYDAVMRGQLGREFDQYKDKGYFDFERDKAMAGVNYGYDIGMAGYQSGLRTAEDKARQTYGAQLDPSQYYDPGVGGMVIGNRYDTTQGQPRLAQRPTGEAEWESGQIKEAQKYVADMRTTATKNAEFGNQLSQLSALSDSINQGKVGAIANYVSGIAPQLNLDPTVDDAQAFEAIIQQIIPAMKVAGSGTFTDDDAKRMEKSLPSASGSVGGRAKIIAQLQEKLAMQQEEVAAMEDYIKVKGRLDDNYYRMRNEFYKAWGAQ